MPAPLYVVPRDEVWVTCPRCDRAALVRGGSVRCAHCAFFRDGASVGYMCRCCGEWEGDGPELIDEVSEREVERFCQRCGVRASVREKVRRGLRPADSPCACGGVLTPEWTRAVDFDTRTARGLDALFGLPFHLRTTVRGNILWVANREHLDYLRAHIGASVRKPAREPGSVWVKEIDARLPAWMTRASARADVMAGLDRLEAMLGRL